MTDKLGPGDVFKTKQSDKTRSPYQRIVKVIDARNVETEGIDETMNRAQRRHAAKEAKRNAKTR